MKRKHQIKLVCLCLLGLCVMQVKAQEAIYSQFMNAPLQLNPALTGMFAADLRFEAIYRRDWIPLIESRNSFALSLDYKLPARAGAIGVLFSRSSSGLSYVRRMNAAATYAYQVTDGEDYSLSFGLRAGISSLNIDEQKLIFSKQLDPRLGIVPSVPGLDDPNIKPTVVFDAGVGLNLVYKQLQVGASAMHVNRPNESLTGKKAPLPVRISVYMSYEQPIGYDVWSVTPSVLYCNQDKQRLFIIGASIRNNWLTMGLFYRGDTATRGQQAVVASLVFNIFGTDSPYAGASHVGLSHDVPTGKYPYGSVQGSSELSVGYEMEMSNRNW